MIVVRLQGGLGNQLFQYATGRALADRLGRELRLDLRDCSAAGRGPRGGDTPRPYLLDRLRIRAQPASALGLLARGYPSSRRMRGLWRGLGLGLGRLIQEPPGAFMDGLSGGAGGSGFAYLDGYWQSWRYFQAERASLAADLRLVRPPAGPNAALLGGMRLGKAVCVHVRRGDYVSHPAAAAFHGLMGPEYYRAALKRLGAAARGAVLYVFSDDPAWVRGNRLFPGKQVVVDQNGAGEPQEDLRLMAACRHFIIANSSFSWWAAYLGAAPGKRVVAPQRWFKSGAPTPDLCPPEWARI